MASSLAIARVWRLLLAPAQTRFGLTEPFSLKQDQSSSHRSAEHSSTGCTTTRGTVPGQRVRTLLLCYIHYRFFRSSGLWMGLLFFLLPR